LIRDELTAGNFQGRDDHPFELSACYLILTHESVDMNFIDMKKRVRVLRTCNADGTSHNGFQWPLEVGAMVECPDWNPLAECGNGLHGLAEGKGDWKLLDWSPDAKALILEVEADTIIELDGKVKFPRAVVRRVGALADLLCDLICDAERIAAQTKKLITADEQFLRLATSEHYSQLVISGDYSRLAASGMYSQLATSGAYSQLAASGANSRLIASGVDSQLAASGTCSQLATSGDYTHLVASGNDSRLVASGDDSQLAASGDRSQLVVSGARSQLAASGVDSQLAANGDYSLLAASGARSQLAADGAHSQLAASGFNSRLVASGDNSQLAASGDHSQLAAHGAESVVISAAPHCRARTGDNGAIALTWHDGKRPRISVGYVGEGLEANTWYQLDEQGAFVEIRG
jgi:hypothetical protein